MAFCPRCRKETVFVEAGGLRTCSECGVQFALSEARTSRASDWAGSEAMGFLQVLFRAVLVLIALIVIGIGVLFAGCALLAGGFH